MAILYSPHEKQIAAHRAQEKRILLFWGRQVGKTFFSINHTLINALKNQGTYFMIFSTYKQAHEVVWREFLSIMPPELLKVCKTNESELTIELPYLKGPMAYPGMGWMAIKHDETKPKSIIQLLGSDQAVTHRGRHCHGQVFDEYAFQNPEYLRSVYNPMLSTTDGWQIFMSTPNGFNHWYDMVETAQEDPEWFYSEATWRDNPLVSRDFVDRERRSADKAGEMSKFLAEYELQFRTVEGPVYPAFERKVHVVPSADLPTEGALYVGIDFGFDNPTAAVFVLIDYDDNWWVIDELYRRETLMSDLIPMIRQKLGDKRLVLMVGDSAAPEAVAEIQKFFPAVPIQKRKDSIPEGIRIITEKLQPRVRLVGMPKPKLFVGSNCKNFIFEMDQYHYPAADSKKNSNEQPIKKNDHLMDALRYLALHLKYNKLQEDKPINSKVRFNSYGVL